MKVEKCYIHLFVKGILITMQGTYVYSNMNAFLFKIQSSNMFTGIYITVMKARGNIVINRLIEYITKVLENSKKLICMRCLTGELCVRPDITNSQ